MRVSERCNSNVAFEDNQQSSRDMLLYMGKVQMLGGEVTNVQRAGDFNSIQ